MRLIVAVILSLITGVGGHFLNRRWDRAILFLALFPAWGLAVSAWFGFQTNNHKAIQSSDISSLLDSSTTLLAAGVVVLLLCSVFLTARDAIKSENDFVTDWNLSAVTGAVLTSLFSLIAMIYSVIFIVLVGNIGLSNTAGSEKTSHPSVSFSHHFWSHDSYGGSDYEISNPALPPSGDGYLNFRFLYKGLPAVGVTFKVRLDGKFESEDLLTDENGFAHIRMPAGSVYINSLQVSGWSHMPNDGGEFGITNGYEQKFKLHSETKYNWFESEGIKVNTFDDPGVSSLTFNITPKLEVLWPSKEDEKSVVDHHSAEIRWDQVPGASTYLLKIKQVERDGLSSSYYSIVSKRVDGESSFPLSRLGVVQKDGEEEKEYLVHISAFSEDGSFITDSVDFHDTGSFTLADGYELMKEEITSSLSSGMSAETYKQREKDKKRMDIIGSLIEEERYNLAGDLLDTITVDYKQGEQVALRSYMLAKQSRCNEAQELFAKAKELGGCECTLKKARKLCK